MNTYITLPKKWKPGCSKSFAKWYKNRVKSHHIITEDYNLIKKPN